MASKSKQIYYALPPSIQDFAISALGYRRRFQRFGGLWKRLVAELMQSQWWSEQQIRNSQLQKLKKIVGESYTWSPYYREAMDAAGIAPEEIRDLSDLKRLPLVEKETLRARTSDFHNKAPWRKPIEWGQTSGSTGTPLTIPGDREAFATALALLERQYRWAGTTFFDKHVRLTGVLISREDNPGRPFRYNYAWNQLLCSSYHLTKQNMPQMAEAMAKFKPVYLHCYPSAGYVFARWLNANPPAKSGIRLKAVFATAETLYEFQTAEMEQAFGCPVLNHYGSSEGSPFIGQCERGSLHVSDESGIIEFLRPDGTPARPGEEAEMVVTSFRAFSLPLIRYRIGDYATLSDAPCPCGRELTVVTSIGGRHDDLMVTTDRGVVGRLSQVTKVAPQSFIESQIEETRLDEFVFRYVADPKFFVTQRDLPAVEQDMKQRLGSNIRVSFERLDRIPRDARGKYRSMIGLPRELWPTEYR